MANSDSDPNHKVHKQKKINFLYVSIIAHILFGVAAAYLIVAIIAPRPKTQFTAAPPSQHAVHPDRQKEQQVQRENMQSAPPNQKIVSTEASHINLPAMPAMPSANMSQTMGAGDSTGIGALGSLSAGGAGTGGVFTPFGFRNGNGLKGEFYDIKQTPDRKPSDADSSTFAKKFTELSRTFAKTFDEKLFAPYFKAPDPLYASQIFVPNIDSDTAAKAFGVQNYVQGTYWFALYKGRVIPPVSGSYRFVGFGDAVLVIRFNGQTVLDHSETTDPKEWPPKNYKHYIYEYDKDSSYYTATRQGHMEGKPFNVSAGQTYDIEILIGDQGGLSQFQVFLEKDGVNYQKDSDGNPILPIFRVTDAQLPDFSGKQVPVYDTSPPAWSIWKMSTLPSFFNTR